MAELSDKEIKLLIAQKSSEAAKSFGQKFDILRVKIEDFGKIIQKYELDTIKESIDEIKVLLEEVKEDRKKHEIEFLATKAAHALTTQEFIYMQEEVRMLKEEILRIQALDTNDRKKIIEEIINNLKTGIEDSILQKILEI